jgi:hypothetical protein
MRTAILLPFVLSGCGSSDPVETGSNPTAAVADTSDPSDATDHAPNAITEAAFLRRYADKFCEMYVECESPVECGSESSTTYDTLPSARCDYNPLAAFSCVNDEWGCDATQLPVPPLACSNVYTNCTGTYGTGTSTTETTGT